MTRQQALITAGVMAALAVAALDSTVVGTAMPTIIGELGGLQEYGWVFAGYLLAATVTVPLYAKLADTYGRKPIFFVGLVLFVVGSLCCGLSGSMPALVLFRTVQGLGAGALQPIAFTIVGDTFEVTLRARIQGLFSAVWGVAAIIGPALGGLITSTIGWRWVFFINLPVGLIAGILIGIALHEDLAHRAHRIDWLGAATLSVGISLLLFAVSEGGSLFGWTSPTMGLLLIGAVACLVAFVAVERRAPEPLIDLELVRRPVVAVGLAVGALAGAVMFTVTAYVPPMVQGVHGGTPVTAGAAVAAMSIGWPVGSVVGGRAMLAFGPRRVVVTGSALLVVGTALVTQLGRIDSLAYAMLATGVTGLGMGLAATTILVTVQTQVEWQRRGMATGLVQFSRTIGGSVGVGILGAVLAAGVGAGASAILDPVLRSTIPVAQLAAMRDDLAASLQLIYLAAFAFAVAALGLAALGMPAVQLVTTDTREGAERRREGTVP